MEYYNENGFLLDEILLALRSDSWDTSHVPIEMTDFHYNINGLNNEYLEENHVTIPLPCTTTTTTTTISSFEEYIELPFDQNLNYSSLISELFSNTTLELTDSSNNWQLDTSLFTSSPILENEVIGNSCSFQDLEVGNIACKLERAQSIEAQNVTAPTFNIGLCPEEIKVKTKKQNGQPSKNLMAERRRRKRLNDRLSMLRSVVPKISKMDRTSILGDTIDYTKELLERINILQQEMKMAPNQLNLMSIFKNEKPIEMFVRNSPKFDVERRNIDTRVEINCAGKSSLLLSTLTTLDLSGQDIQQCVISCFNDFAMQASCFEELDAKQVLTNVEDIKQALFRNAGYGGRCL